MPLTIIKESIAALSPELKMKIIMITLLLYVESSTHIFLIRKLRMRCNRLSILGSRRYSTKQVQ
jgi:hypothetical protein